MQQDTQKQNSSLNKVKKCELHGIWFIGVCSICTEPIE